ncbi:MAG: type II toxin-antitoxin system prevent-host-death family antitoxin [Lachnospiraceae bacterium]|nr:type II toxin-antitoxin system prevent-host-death family antitoxin [Lachnospiraceae bacterium]
MTITATELKNNLSKYLLLSMTEDIYITQYGKVINKLTNPFQDRVETARSLFGILSDDVNVEAAREEWMKRKTE